MDLKVAAIFRAFTLPADEALLCRNANGERQSAHLDRARQQVQRA
jgi:hypothetical protein